MSANDEGVLCPECGSKSLTWVPHMRNTSGVADGRLRVHEVACDFILGCDTCSETVMVVPAGEVAAVMLLAAKELRDAIEAHKGKRGAFMALGASDPRTIRLWAAIARFDGGAE